MEIEKVREPMAKYYPRYKYSDYEKWEGRWELISGAPYAMSPTPDWKHKKVSERIAIQLARKLENCKKCTSSLPVDWIISDDTIVQLDNMVVCYEPEGKFLTKPPAIIFEILSPGAAVKDKEVKYYLYESQRVKYHILVDIEKKSADIFILEHNRYEKFTTAKKESVNLKANGCKFDFDFSKIWE